MANPYYTKMKSTGASKMAKTSGSSKNYESQEDKAERRYGAGASKFADGGQVLAGDVLPIRPPGPADTAARMNQIKNQGAQSPNTGSKSNNIHGLYGHITEKS